VRGTIPLGHGPHTEGVFKVVITDKLLPYEVAGILGITPDTVRDMERAGRLHADRIGGMRIFNRRDVEKLHAERERLAAARRNVLATTE